MSSSPLRAVIWDVDGTVAETERDGHRVAFNEALRELGVPWQWDVAHYGDLLRVTGGVERLLHDMGPRAQAPRALADREALARAVHQRKNARYAERVARGDIALRPGVRRVMDDCAAQGLALAIATTSSRSNVDALFACHFGGADWAHRFAAIVCAEDAPRKKPDPQAYAVALQRLGLDATQAIAIEDSTPGLAAARASGLACVITRSLYFAADDFTGCAALCEDLDSTLTWPDGLAPRVDVSALRAIHRRYAVRSAEAGGQR